MTVGGAAKTDTIEKVTIRLLLSGLSTIQESAHQKTTSAFVVLIRRTNR